MGVLSSMLSGASYDTELGNMEDGPKAGHDGHFAAAIRVSAFEDVDRFRARVGAAIRQMRDCRRAPGVDRIYGPSEKEFMARRLYLRDGIPLNGVTLADLRAAAAERDIAAAAAELTERALLNRA